MSTTIDHPQIVLSEKMLTLGFDTATELGTIGLVDGEEIKGEYTFKAKESQSEKLLASIDWLLEQVEIEITEVQRIAVSRGPGSFTGLRIGISTAKGLAHGLEVPLVGIPLTTCYYSRVDSYSGPVCTLIKDRRDLVYVAAFDRQGHKVLGEKSISVDKLKEDLDRELGETRDPVLVIGDALPEHRDSLLKNMENSILTEGEINYPSGTQLAFLGRKAKEDRNELTSIEPLYAQRPIAEINWTK